MSQMIYVFSQLSIKIILVFGLFLFAISSPAYAEYFKIKNYEVNININKDSRIDVEEIIDVYFNTQRHGIFRDIPYKYKVTEVQGETAERTGIFGKTYKVYISNIETPGFEHKTLKKGNNIRIRIGNKHKYVSGNVKYIIRYSVIGAVNFFKNFDEFYWNVIGTKWPVSIEKVNFTITFPDFTPSKEQVFAVKGFLGDTDKVKNISISNRIISGYVNEPLPPYNGITVGIQFPKGIINLSLFQKIKIIFYNNISYFIPIVIFLLLFVLWLIIGKDEKTIKITHFYPPKGMTSAEAGMLIDDSIDNKDLISLIFYWAANGLIEIEELEKESFFGKPDFILIKKKDLSENAKAFEKTIFNGLFPAGTKNVRISTLKNNFYSYMEEAKEQLDREIKKAKLYEPGTRFIGKILMGSAFVFLIFIGLAVSIKRYDFAISLGTSMIIVFAFGYIMPKKSRKGLEQYQILQGFADFIKRVEKPKLKVLLKKDPSYFEKTIPFAIALNVMDEWTKKFDGLLTEPPSWYRSSSLHSGHMFNAMLLSRSINHSIASMNSAFVSKPSSSGAGSGSSGFGGLGGGGGFSGGGFGGGGGGSW